MNVTDLETYVSGDTGTDTLITVVDEDGNAIDLTGSTSITLACVSPQRDVLSVAGAISGDPAVGHVIIEDLAQAFTPTASRRIVHFEGVVKWTQLGETHYSRDRVKFAIELFP
jgi:hypothetical protein